MNADSDDESCTSVNVSVFSICLEASFEVARGLSRQAMLPVSTCLMKLRIWESVEPRQSSSSLIFASIRSEGDPPFSELFFFMS
jgi:hypothetical protein